MYQKEPICANLICFDLGEKTMKRFFFPGVLTLILGAIAAAAGFAQRPNTSTPVSLRATLEALNSDGAPCAVCGDGLSEPSFNPNEYVNGVNSVRAYFDKYGNFYFNFSGTRSVNVYYRPEDYIATATSSPVPQGYIDTPQHSSVDITTFKAGDLPSPYVHLQNMQPGGAFAQCVMTGWTLDGNTSVILENNYHRNGSIFYDARNSYAVVTRLDQDTWEMEPKKTYLDSSNQPVTIACNNTTGQIESVASVLTKQSPRKNQVTSTSHGLYRLPFKLTLRRK